MQIVGFPMQRLICLSFGHSDRYDHSPARTAVRRSALAGSIIFAHFERCRTRIYCNIIFVVRKHNSFTDHMTTWFGLGSTSSQLCVTSPLSIFLNGMCKTDGRILYSQLQKQRFYTSHIMRKKAFCICQNKDTDLYI